MLSALRSAAARSQQSSLFSYSLPNHITRKPAYGIRFTQAASGPKQPDSANEMDSKKKQSDHYSKTLDSMSSFGEGYATRSDEEGFGGTCGRNKYAGDDDEEKKGHGHDAEFDHNQGSEVKEKEKARHQNKVGT